MRRDLAVVLFLVVGTLTVYGQVIRHDFVNLDDDVYVYENPHVQKGLTWEGAGWAFTSLRATNWHPLTWLSHMLDCELFGLNAGYHHLVNVLIHILNSVLLYLLLKGMTGAVWRSATVAALFALHPLHVESVAWVAERKDVLSTFFFMLTLWAYGGYAVRPGWTRYGWVFGFMALGLMAKPMLVTLPFLMLLLDGWPLGRFQPAERGKVLRLVAEKAPLFVLVIASCAATFVAQHRGGATGLSSVVPFGFRVANALVSYVVYLGKMVWPSGMAVLYPYRLTLSPLHWLGAGVILVGISSWVARARRRHPCLAVGWLWYLGTLVPVIGLVQVGNQSMADRYTYVPLIGIFLMVVWYAADVTARWRRGRAWLAGLAGLLIVGCMVSTWLQLAHWRNSVTLYERALRVTKGNALAHNNLGYALEKQGNLTEALSHYTEAIRISPEYWLAHSNLGNVLMAKEEPERAIRHYREAVRINPEFVLAHNRLGVALAKQGNQDEAIAHYREAIRLDPAYAPAQSNFGVALMEQGNLDEALEHCRDSVRLNPKNAESQNNLGVVLDRRGTQDEAVAHYREAIRLDPDYAKPYENLGLLLARRGEMDQAISCFRKALDVDSDSPEAHKGLAMALAEAGRSEESVKHYREAIRLNPHDPSAYNNLAWIRAVHADPSLRNGAEAVELAEKACSLWGKRDPNLLDTLAAAYAEAGRFPEAIRTMEEAVSLAASGGLQEQAQELGRRLEGYRAGHPYREGRGGDDVQR